MYIEELIIEGFKSYAARTHISGWDSQFNAITGLNGSGKSNVLDAICFVLGISNLSQVRAQNLQDLIYKRGQAGISKASVTIVFNNEDREKSPVGFEQYNQITVTRQILLGGRNKYLVNGHNAQQQTVQTLFQSVSLNINNPHFLIMQGRITKVLNMKPMEILGMIEEAAGTKMFEERKTKALATMLKKEKKVDEITSILTEEIGPKLDQLRGEKRAFLDYQKTESEMERINRLVVAYEYKRHEDKLNRTGSDFNDKAAAIQELEQDSLRLAEEIKVIEGDIEMFHAKREQELRNGGRFEALQKAVADIGKDMVRTGTQKELNGSSIQDEERNLESTNQLAQDIRRHLTEKQQQFLMESESFKQVKQGYDEKVEEVRRMEQLLQSLTTGVAAEEGHESGYLEQIQDAKNKLTQASTEEEQTKLKIDYMTKDLKDKQPRATKAQSESKGLLTEIAAVRRAKADLEKQLSRVKWNAEDDQRLQHERESIQASLAATSEKYDMASRQLSNAEFFYTDPTPNFDRSTVKGLVANLIEIPEHNAKASTALEICAGGRLYNVVVDTEIVGSQLLEKGRLRKRVTIIPLNKIQPFVASDRKVTEAKQMASGKVDLALQLVGFEKEVKTAMEYVFGNTLICESNVDAKLVAFDKNIRMKSVTFEGDVYDPSGTLTGGSSSTSHGILQQLQELRNIRRDLRVQQQKFAEVEGRLKSSEPMRTEYNRLKQGIDLKDHEISLLQTRIDSSTHAQMSNEVLRLESALNAEHTKLEEARKRQVEIKKRINDLEKEMREFNSNKDSKLAELNASTQLPVIPDKLRSAKAHVSEHSQGIRDKQREIQALKFELEQLEADLKKAEEDAHAVRDVLEQLHTERAALIANIERMSKQHQSLQAELEAEREQLQMFNEELDDLQKALKMKTAKHNDSKLELQKLKHEIDRFSKERAHAEHAIEDLERKYDWIVDQKQYFGQEGSQYDYHNVNLSDARRTLRQLEDKYNTMRKKINVKVMNMIDNVEKKEASLKGMLSTVQKDKMKIEDTINSLEDYKKQALEKTWEKVDVDFGAIFGDLLPGNTAKLIPSANDNISTGLEVKVCLGGVWKQSLAELSGGQRSLIALSLILSLLQFKPAPMYILDEVDAALDLSHTQNIGGLLRTRFKGSQFIVVSLKEGMFNNANVLFRTRFRDGTSVVERIKNKSDDKENVATQKTGSTSSRKRARETSNRELTSAA
ncbi:hypothetical protein BZG36_05299 [Bifiguratus adelaidae]|uniref:Structural maintenance of chromosomes protein n=1 Tax=Bifiguratus adelaidae TaxID=1938954 RepID=A0A261XTT8_9FUNG|nr:hypothetical protein BZG36_05299 [Bifiguratus adelaidae]